MIATTRLALAAAAALLAAMVPALAWAASPGPGGGLVVSTDRGAGRGELAGDVRQVLGVPYAASPVGDLRWRPPQQHAAWRGGPAATPVPRQGPQPGGTRHQDPLFPNLSKPPPANTR